MKIKMHFLNKFKSNSIFPFVDFLALYIIFYLGYLVSIDFQKAFADQFYAISIEILIFIVFKVGLHFFTRTYSILWKYGHIDDYIKLFVIISISNLFVLFYTLVFNRNIGLSFLVISMMIEYLYFVFTRLLLKIYEFYTSKNKSNSNYIDRRVRSIIIGAGNAGTIVYDSYINNVKTISRFVCFVDDNSKKIGNKLRGQEIIGNTNNIVKIINEYKINEVLIAIPTADSNKIASIISEITNYDISVKIKVFPGVSEIFDTSVERKLRDVKIEDLLGRKTINLDIEGLNEFIKNKVIFVSGGGGSIGSELCRQIIKYLPSKLVIFDIYENNAYTLQQELNSFVNSLTVSIKPEVIVLIGSIRDISRINEIFNEYKPNIIFHAAAHKHVPLMEDSPKEAVKNNVIGTYNLALAASEHNVDNFIFISTDKAVNPPNIMGMSKRFSEIVIQAFSKSDFKTIFAVVRFGNVLGSSGSVIPLFANQIKNGGPVTVTHKEITRYFMTIPEACQLVLQSGVYSKGGERFILDMGKPVKIIDLAENMIRLSGFEPYSDIDIKFTGLRPGEKMYEELLIDVNSQTKTENDLIFIERSSVNKSIEGIKNCIFNDIDFELENSLFKKHFLSLLLKLQK